MSLRLDDINQKENAMKLSLTTIDYRLAKMEEMALQTAENLYMLQSLVAVQQGLVRQASDQSGPLSGSSAGSAGSAGGSLDYGYAGPPPASAPVTRGASMDPSMLTSFFMPENYTSPGPGSKRRKKIMNEERLRPFTDYSKTHRVRPPFNRAITVATPGRLGRELTIVQAGFNVNHDASNFTQSPKQPVAEQRSPPARPSSPHLGSDLYHRRRNKALSRLRSQGLFKALKQENLSEGRARRGRGSKSPARVTFSDPPSKEASPDQRRSMSADAVEMFPTFSGNVGKQGFCTTQNLAHYTMAAHPVDMQYSTKTTPSPSSPPVDIPSGSTSRSINPPSSLGVNRAAESRADSSHSPAVTPSSVPIQPIVTPNHTEYTSITDEIDTTGVNFGSPCGSPTTPRQFYFGVEVDVDLYTKKPRKNHRTLSATEAQQLKLAEDSEHEAMEMMIRKRMRQISLTESDGLSDIARHVMQEMELQEQVQKEEADKPGYHSDEEVTGHRGQLSPEDIATLTKVSSEPNLTQLSGSFEKELTALSPVSTKVETHSPLPPSESATSKAPSETFYWPENEKKAGSVDKESEEETSAAAKRETVC